MYGAKAMLPLELQKPSLYIVIQEGLREDENHKLRLTLDIVVEMLPSSAIIGIQQNGSVVLILSWGPGTSSKIIISHKIGRKKISLYFDHILPIYLKSSSCISMFDFYKKGSNVPPLAHIVFIK